MKNRSCAIIPVREFATTKLRLKDILSDDKRAALTATLITRVVKSIQQSRVNQIVVVASNPSEVTNTLPPSPKLAIVRESKMRGGVNSAMTDGMHLAKQEGANKLLLLPSDLPRVNSPSVDKALDLLQERDLIICPSLKKDGTNLLGLDASRKFELHYDDDSYSKHCNEAKQNGFDYVTLEWAEFSNDIDDPRDLERLSQNYRAPNFEDLLSKISSE
ncbi:MAG: 2-phospho-L-lactate guanylyltransferase [Nitrososphaerales archaeon]